MTKLVVFSMQTPEPEFDYPAEERRVLGKPLRTSWNFFENSSAQMNCGIWACEPGSWKIRFSDRSDEFFCVIEGLARLHDEAGNTFDVGPGEAAVIPAGFSGIFEVVKPIRKYYVILERHPQAE